MTSFEAFDPLKAKSEAASDVQAKALKREITNILKSYVGWYDPFCELVQNALDSVEERCRRDEEGYEPKLWITINIKDNHITVTDNGISLDEKEYRSFLAPDFSFKSGESRGQKGVGATYLAYGFNYLQVSTKSPEFSAIGKMVNAKSWIDDENPAGNPEMVTDNDGSIDSRFHDIDRGVSICVSFDKTTYPADLGWIQVNKAESWMQILRVKTAIGALFANNHVGIVVKVVDKDGNETSQDVSGIEYLWPHTIVKRSASIEEIQQQRDKLYNRGKKPDELPGGLRNLDLIYGQWDADKLAEELGLSDDDLEICRKHKPFVYGGYAYSIKVWDSFNEGLSLRSKQRILYGGIQIGANNMPQGELIQIPLRRNIGRQNNAHFVVHFTNCEPDYGRKGFQNEIVTFAKNVSSKLVDVIYRCRLCLRPTTGAPSDLQREENVANWKDEMERHEKERPLKLISEHFFLPLREVSITSTPTREQDVIALFNQLLAGGVVRGIRIMSTSERLTYDGLYRIIINEPTDNHKYDKTSNPLGVTAEVIANYSQLPFITTPRVLEYKYSLDGLIEDIECGNKNSNEIDLVVVWETGDSWTENYKITSLLDENNLYLRQYHGVTHTMTNLTTGQHEMDLIVLEELIEYLNSPESCQDNQVNKYEEV